MRTRRASILLTALLSLGPAVHAADVCTGTIIPGGGCTETIIPGDVIGHMSSEELEVLDLLNEARQSTSRPPILAVSCAMTQAAQAHSERMLAAGRWSHSGARDEIVVNTNGVGADSPARAVDWWISSSLHYTIMVIYPHPYVGIGQACNTTKTACYWTVQFSEVPRGTCRPWPTGGSTTPPTVADLVISTVYSPPPSATAGGRFRVRDAVLNQGTANAGASATRYYLAAVPVRGTTDILLTGTRSVVTLRPRQLSKGVIYVTVPPSTPRAAYYLIACADDLRQVGEADEGNNCQASNTRIQVQ